MPSHTTLTSSCVAPPPHYYDAVDPFYCIGSSCKVKTVGSNTCSGTAELDCRSCISYYLNENGDLTYFLSDALNCQNNMYGNRQLWTMQNSTQQQVVQVAESTAQVRQGREARAPAAAPNICMQYNNKRVTSKHK